MSARIPTITPAIHALLELFFFLVGFGKSLEELGCAGEVAEDSGAPEVGSDINEDFDTVVDTDGSSWKYLTAFCCEVHPIQCIAFASTVECWKIVSELHTPLPSLNQQC